MSDNINKDFFSREVPDTEEIVRADGKTEVRHIGTIRMLEVWLNRRFRAKDPAPLDEMLESFRNVRRLRQKPSHFPTEDKFEQRFIHEQRELMIAAYKAIRTLRLIFTNNPAAKGVEVPKWLWKGDIWTK